MLELRGELRLTTPSPAPRDEGPARRNRRQTRLEGVVHNEILPRLLQAVPRPVAPTPALEGLARALIAQDDGVAREALALLSRADAPPVLAALARLLGDWWVQDACDFFAVTQGVARLQAYWATLAAPVADEATAPAMLMLTPPGETHRFGADMAAALFRREGWRVERADGDLQILREQSFDAIALSCACERAAASLPRFLAEIKAQGRPVILGGALFLGDPARGQGLGADFIASEPEFFVQFSQTLPKPRRS